MIAVDTNVLVYAHREESLYHERAAAAVRDLAEGDTPWGLPVFVLGEFLRVVTHPRVYAPPTSRQAALATVEALLASPTVRVLRSVRSCTGSTGGNRENRSISTAAVTRRRGSGRSSATGVPGDGDALARRHTIDHLATVVPGGVREPFPCG